VRSSGPGASGGGRASPWTYDEERCGVSRRSGERNRPLWRPTAAPGGPCGVPPAAARRSGAEPCGRYIECTGSSPAIELAPAIVAKARECLRWAELLVEPRRQWLRGLAEPEGRIPDDVTAAVAGAAGRRPRRLPLDAYGGGRGPVGARQRPVSPFVLAQSVSDSTPRSEPAPPANGANASGPGARTSPRHGRRSNGRVRLPARRRSGSGTRRGCVRRRSHPPPGRSS
jgi:hypothetical protein